VFRTIDTERPLATRRSIASEPCDRRTLLRSGLRAAAALSFGTGVSALLTGCGDVYRIALPPPPIDYLIDVAPLPPGVADLIAARATKLGLAVPAGIQQTFPGVGEKSTVGARYGDFLAETSPSYSNGAFSAFTDRLPRDTNLAVVQGDESVAAYARKAISQNLQVVTFLAPLRYQTAQITVDSASLGALIAADAAAWARTRLRGPATAVFVTPTPATAAGSPTYEGPRPVSATAAEQAIRVTFTRMLPNVTLSTIADLVDPVGALKADPGLRIVISADAMHAFNLAQTLRQQLSPRQRERLYIGGLGNPSIYAPSVEPPGVPVAGSQLGPASEPVNAAQIAVLARQRGRKLGSQVAIVDGMLRELGRNDVLRAFATVRPRDLAHALVDLPAALLNLDAPYNISIPPVLLTPRSAALAAYASGSRS
jgi:hypothetical protein